jgi:hypothetical protein
LEQTRDSVLRYGEPIDRQPLIAGVRRRRNLMQSISIETSVISFLRENPSASAESVERQRITRRWWNFYRQRYQLVTSQYVVDEANIGNPARAQERVQYLAGIPLASLSSEIDDLAAQIMDKATTLL